MGDKAQIENENEIKDEEKYLNNDMYSKIELYSSFLNNNWDANCKPDSHESISTQYAEQTKKIGTFSNENINDDIEQTEKIKFTEYQKPIGDLITVETKKISIKRIIILVLLLILIFMLFGRCVAYTNEKISIKNYEILIGQTHDSVVKFQEEEAQRQRIKAEEERKAKIANRNKKDFTPEQIEKVRHIYSSSNKKIAYLTFDDGPSVNVTPLILDVLKNENIKATFFVLGTNATWNPEILKRIRNEGHYIANHGYSHKYDEIYKDYDSLMNDYNLCEQAIKNSLGEPDYKTRIFRFPGGSTGGKYARFKKEAKAKMQEQNITYLDWNALTADAEGVPTKESILQNLKDTTAGKNNVVILMHDLSTKILTYETLTDVINYLREEGYEFGDIYELLGE